MHVTEVELKDGTKLSGHLLEWRPENGTFTLHVPGTTAYTDQTVVVRLEECVSAVTHGTRLALDRVGDLDLLVKARIETWKPPKVAPGTPAQVKAPLGDHDLGALFFDLNKFKDISDDGEPERSHLKGIVSVNECYFHVHAFLTFGDEEDTQQFESDTGRTVMNEVAGAIGRDAEAWQTIEHEGREYVMIMYPFFE